MLPVFLKMGMCAIKGPRVLHDDAEDGELSPRSTMSSASSSSSSSSGYGSASSLELDSVEAAAPVWQRTIPKGRRCKPLSFSGMILYDENGKQVELSLEELDEDGDEEYFSPQRNLAEQEGEFKTPPTVA